MIADGVIIAHAGVDDGAKRVCLSLLTMPERTDVYGYMEADVVIMIGTPDPTKHLEVLEQLNHIIEDKKSLQLLKKAKKPEDIINKTDKKRASYYKFYTGNLWKDMNNYDLVINTGKVGIDNAVATIIDYVRKYGYVK